MNIGKMMKQVQKLQEEMARVQNELKEKTVEGTAGGGVVKVVANGQYELVSVTIDPEVVDPEDVEMLQDLIVAAANDAMRRAHEMATNELAKVTGGLELPAGGFPGLF
ncbi:MAG: YbaB/EbfC family nucleoid-associated protein [Firmicutes bacterium]|nr:YbaB/EbfC family nucleoid-associated protein [Bacillota bacterium]